MAGGWRPLIVGLGGSPRAGSSTELALRYAMKAAEGRGALTALVAGPELVLPMYAPEQAGREPAATRLVDALRRCDGVIIASPGYHGSVSGLVKNALDYVEELRGDDIPYLDGRAVGCITCAYGWQATGSTLAALRSIVHALRGWPTPIGVAINTSGKVFDSDGNCLDPSIARQLELQAEQVVEFAMMRNAFKSARAREAVP
jgi:FMN reductase